MDAFLPGVNGWEAIYNSPMIWHFRFNGPTPEALVKGRERIYFEHFWNDFAADKRRSIPEVDRQAYTAAYSRPGRMRSGWAYSVSFQQAAKDFAQFSKTKPTMPVLSIGGDKANGDALAQQVKLVASNASFVTLANTGHWVMEESPQETANALTRFLSATPTSTASPQIPSTRPASTEILIASPNAVDPRGGSCEPDWFGANWQLRSHRCEHESAVRRSFEGWPLHHRAVCAGSHDDPGAPASRRSDGHGGVGNLAFRVRKPIRRRRAEEPATR
jgi:hypothetical protein